MNPLKYWVWNDNLTPNYKIRAYLFNTLIWLILIIYGIGIPLAIIIGEL